MPSWVRASLNALSCSVSTGHDALAQMDLVIDAPLEIAVGANRWRGGLVVSGLDYAAANALVHGPATDLEVTCEYDATISMAGVELMRHSSTYMHVVAADDVAAFDGLDAVLSHAATDAALKEVVQKVSDLETRA